MGNRALCVVMLTLGVGLPAVCVGQTSTTESSTPVAVDDSPFLSGRGSGMAGAISTSADSVDAPYFNPACIGGCTPRKSAGFVRELYFPHVGIAANRDTTALVKEMRAGGAANDSSAASAVMNAHAGNRQYARLSLFPSVVLGRLMFGPIIDQQVAAVPAGDDMVSMHARRVMGFGMGTSVADTSGRLHLGVFTSYLTRQEIQGDLNYLDVLHSDTRSATLKDATTNYSGQSMTVGLMWKIADRGEPTLGIAVRDLGDTKYKASTSGADNMVIEQDMTIGFSVKPRVSTNSSLLWVVEATRLQQEILAMNKKFRTGIEWALWGDGSFARFAVRGGYNLAGVSAGMSLNLGVLMISVASQAEDIGVDNAHEVERRNVATLGLNIIE